MPEIHPVFPVFDVARDRAEKIIADAEQVHNGDLDQLGADITIMYPVYRDVLIGVRDDGAGGRCYAVMLLETDPVLYDRARRDLASS